ncbi:phosphatidylinositol phosphate synthase [Propionibacteriaceae bacterium G1746]|uniref:phosphatidylinositol phosphate synthase n=1 Tax=Aestuariimicrobium sp. G57 TaxID=3418485 RepID=UPI003C195EAF
MLERFRAGWAAAMTPPARLLIALKVHPDAVTWAGTLITVVLALVFFPQGWLWQGTLLITAFIFSDGIDGQMARLLNRKSQWGAFLDSSLDRFGDGALFMGLALFYAGPGDSTTWAGFAIAALVLGQVTSYVKARGEALGMTVRGGLAARADRILVLFLGSLLTGLAIDGHVPSVLRWALPVALCWLVIAGVITVGQRMAQVKGQAAPATSFEA